MDDATLTITVCELFALVPGWEWRPDGPAFTEAETGIFYGAIGALPHRAIGVRVYAADDDDAQHTHARRLQLRWRGRPNDPADADRQADIGYLVLNGLSRVRGISDARRISMVPLGADDNGRQERTDNYRIIFDNPEASA